MDTAVRKWHLIRVLFLLFHQKDCFGLMMVVWDAIDLCHKILNLLLYLEFFGSVLFGP